MENFKFQLEDELIVTKFKDKVPYDFHVSVVGRAQYAGLPENRYLCQAYDESIGLDFGKGTWYEESKLRKK